MNKTIVFHYVSRATLYGSALFLLPALVSLYYGEKDIVLTFLIVAAAVAMISTPLAIIKPKNKKMYNREALVIAAFLWVIFPLLGALPFYISGAIPSFVDSVFESVSGFTTTGSSILSQVENLPRGILFWRSFTHWVGGMGVLVLLIAILPSSSSHAMALMRAECAGPQVGKIVPKGRNSAAVLYIMYAALTLVLVILLVAGGMPFFDSVCNAMGTAGTGGFSVRNGGIADYDSTYLEAVLTGGMIAFGVNFSLYYFILVRRFKDAFKNSELRAYIAILLIAMIAVGINIYPVYGSVLKCIRYSAFQVASIMTSTGFATADFCTWPMLSQMILVILMFIGACGGSTGGGFKVQRVLITYKSASRYLKKTVHPNSVKLIKSDDKAMDTDTVHGVLNYLVIYIGILLVSMLLIAANNGDFTTASTSVITCMNNIGPGLGNVGPMSNFGFYSDFSKCVLSVDMLLGRLECLPLVILISPSVWRKKF